MQLFKWNVWCRTAQGAALSGANIYVCSQPTNLTVPPGPLAQIWGDINSLRPLNQLSGGSEGVPTTDGGGWASFYAEAGLYTIVSVFRGQIQTSGGAVLTDTNIGGFGTALVAGANVQISGNTISVVIPPRTASITYTIDGGGSVPTTGNKGQIAIPANCTISGWVLTADQSGSAVLDVLRSSYAGFPTTASITGSDKPTLSSAQKNENLAVSAWTTALSAGDQLQFNLVSIATATRLNLTLNVVIP